MQIIQLLAEHAGRYRRMAQQLVAEGNAVYASDLRGPGVPKGLTVYVSSGSRDPVSAGTRMLPPMICPVPSCRFEGAAQILS